MLWNEFGWHNLQIRQIGQIGRLCSAIYKSADQSANWQIGMANLQIGQIGRLDGTCLIILFIKLLFLLTAKSTQYVKLKRELLHADLRLYETPSDD